MRTIRPIRRLTYKILPKFGSKDSPEINTIIKHSLNLSFRKSRKLAKFRKTPKKNEIYILKFSKILRNSEPKNLEKLFSYLCLVLPEDNEIIMKIYRQFGKFISRKIWHNYYSFIFYSVHFFCQLQSQVNGPII